MNKIIALDIDGTLVVGTNKLDPLLIAYLEKLQKKGHTLFFITGRVFQRAFYALEQLKVPYYLAVQNGALLFEMPSRELLFKRYISDSVIPHSLETCKKEGAGLVIYSGYEFNDLCYFCPKYSSEQALNYITERCKWNSEKYIPLDSFENLPLSQFPSIKSFAKGNSAKLIAKQFEETLFLHAPLCKDPFNEMFYVIQATEKSVNKGQAIKDLLSFKKNSSEVVIAAGDDLNDLPMFEVANISIAMDTAPIEVQHSATIIAPSAKQGGIIVGLSRALN